MSTKTITTKHRDSENKWRKLENRNFLRNDFNNLNANELCDSFRSLITSQMTGHMNNIAFQKKFL